MKLPIVPMIFKTLNDLYGVSGYTIKYVYKMEKEIRIVVECPDYLNDNDFKRKRDLCIEAFNTIEGVSVMSFKYEYCVGYTFSVKDQDTTHIDKYI